MRGLKSIAVFHVNKDSEVFWLDVSVFGFEKVKHSERYTEYFNRIIEWLKEYGLNPEKYTVSAHVMRFRLFEEPPRHTVVLLVTLSLKGRVIYAVLASFTPGVLIYLGEKIKNAGWKSEFLFDMIAERVSGYSSSSE